MQIDTTWAMEPLALDRLCRQMEGALRLSTETLALFGVPESTDDGEKPYQMDGSVAVIPISGPMQAEESWLTRYYGGTSTRKAGGAIRAAAADPAVSAILLDIDSPGGTVAGTAELGDVVAAAKGQKRVVAYAGSRCCSAAYWVASQANAVYAGRTSEVGSIGTCLVVTDYSAMAKEQGITVHAITSAPLKGTGVPGTPITKDQQDDLRRRVMETNALFTQAVQTGRKMTDAQVAAVADARVHVGANAQKLGLVDGIATREAVLTRLKASPSKNTAYAAQGGKETTSMKMTMAERLRAAAAILGGNDEGDTGAFCAQAGASGEAAGAAEAAAQAAPPAYLLKTSVIAPGTDVVLLTALKAAGIETPEALRQALDLRAIGEGALTEARAELEKQAVRLYGNEQGPKFVKAYLHLPIEQIRATAETWAQDADKQFGIEGDGGTQGATRASKPAEFQNSASAEGAGRQQGAASSDALSAADIYAARAGRN